MSRRGSALRPRPGFTLLEAIAALVVIGLTSAAALASFGADVRASARVREAAVAESLAQQRLATLRLLSRPELERLPDTLRRGAFPAPLDGYRWRASSAAVRRQDDLFELRVDVSWPDGSYTLVTRRYRPPAAGAAR